MESTSKKRGNVVPETNSLASSAVLPVSVVDTDHKLVAILRQLVSAGTMTAEAGRMIALHVEALDARVSALEASRN